MSRLHIPSPFANAAPPFPIYNGAGEEIPGFSIAMIKASVSHTENSQRFAVVDKPDGSSAASYMLTSPQPVADAKKGAAVSVFSGGWVKYLSEYEGGTVPEPGDEVGPVNGEWTVSADGSGLIVWHVDEDEGIAWVHALGGGGSGTISVRFEVITVTPALRTAECDIQSIPASLTIGQIPGTSGITNRRITVCDPSGCYFNDSSAATILGVHGVASWRKPLVASPCQEGEYDEFDNQWEVDSLCCDLEPTCG